MAVKIFTVVTFDRNEEDGLHFDYHHIAAFSSNEAEKIYLDSRPARLEKLEGYITTDHNSKNNFLFFEKETQKRTHLSQAEYKDWVRNSTFVTEQDGGIRFAQWRRI